MKVTTLVLTGLVATIPTFAHPGMENTLKEVEVLVRGESDFDPNMLIGDVRHLQDSQLSSSGRDIKQILLGQGNPESGEPYWLVPRRDSRKCRQDTCCIWKYISDEMEAMFCGSSGRCTKWARFAVRMGFHDAGSWSLSTEEKGGGADGSIVLAGETEWRENKGLEDMAVQYQKLYKKYHDDLGFANVGMADLIQMGANVAAVVCPLGPRTRSWVGRKDSNVPNTRGLLPSPFASADSLIQLFKDKSISPAALIALLGAHTTSQQNHVNVTRAGDPQDSTPGVWDTLYYSETLGTAKAPDRVFMFPSDVALAQHPTTKPDFEAFAGRGGQGRWNQDYARAYIRLSLLGVNNINELQECTKVLPMPTGSYRHRDQNRFSKWLQSNDWSSTSKDVSKDIEDGNEISTPPEKIPTYNTRTKGNCRVGFFGICVW